MNVSTSSIVNLAGSMLGFAGTVTLIARILVRNRTAARTAAITVVGVGSAESGTGILPSQPLLDGLAREYADFVSGLSLIAIGFLCQLSAGFVDNSPWAISGWKIAGIVVGVTVVLVVIGFRATTQIHRLMRKRWGVLTPKDVDSASFSEQPQAQEELNPTAPSKPAELEWYKIAVDTRKLELQLFWQRSTFYWGFVSATLAGYIAVKDPALRDIRLLLAHIGVVAGVSWFLGNKGSKYWHENWEQIVRSLEKSPRGMFTDRAPIQRKGWLGAAKYSVSRVTIFFSGFVTLVFIGLAFYELGMRLNIKLPPTLLANWWVVVPFITTAGLIYVLVAGRSSAAVRSTQPSQSVTRADDEKPSSPPESSPPTGPT